VNYGREIEVNLKRKDREGNRVCRKNEESTERSRSGVDKSIGENEEASR